MRVVAGKRILFMLAATGAGAAGAMTLANTLFIEPTSIFSVNYTALMIFMVLVGGLGTFEGPIIGAIVLYFVQNQFGNDGVWYFVGLGGAAILFALLLPRGVWGTLRGAHRPAMHAARLPRAEIRSATAGGAGAGVRSAPHSG